MQGVLFFLSTVSSAVLIGIHSRTWTFAFSQLLTFFEVNPFNDLCALISCWQNEVGYEGILERSSGDWAFKEDFSPLIKGRFVPSAAHTEL